MNETNPILLRIQRIIRLAFAASTLIYMVLAYAKFQQPGESSLDPGQLKTMTTILGVAYVVAVLAMPVVSRFVRESMQRLILRLALAESGAIFGLILSMMSYDPHYAFYFGVPAALLILLVA